MPRPDDGEQIHFECGMPWKDHRWEGKDNICPDDPQGSLWKLDQLRPTGRPEPGPDDDDGKPIPGPRYVGPDTDEVFLDWMEQEGLFDE